MNWLNQQSESSQLIILEDASKLAHYLDPKRDSLLPNSQMCANNTQVIFWLPLYIHKTTLNEECQLKIEKWIDKI